MCLDIAGPRMIAKEDMIVYKVVILKDEKLLTPFQMMEVEIGKTYKSLLSKRSKDATVSVGLHTIAHYTDAKRWECAAENQIVVKCIIPKRSHYHCGDYWIGGGYRTSYASTRLRYVEIV